MSQFKSCEGRVSVLGPRFKDLNVRAPKLGGKLTS